MADTLIIHDGAGGAGGAERTVVQMANALDADLYLGYNDIAREWFDNRCDNKVTVAGIGNKLPVGRDVLTAAHFATTSFEEYDTVVTSGPPAKYYQPYDTQEHYHYLHHPPLHDVLWATGSVKSYVVGAVDRFEAQTIPHIIANSDLTAKRAHTQYNRSVDAVIHPPVEVDRFTHTRDRVDGQFVMLGRLTERKRPSVAVDAFAQLAGDASLIVLGDGPLRESLEQAAPENVEFRGYVDDEEAAEVVEESVGAIALPRLEDFGITTVEYLAAGTPVVAVDEPNTNNIVSSKSGVLVQPNAHDVAKGVRSVLNQSWNNAEIAAEAEQYNETRFVEEIKEAVQESCF